MAIAHDESTAASQLQNTDFRVVLIDMKLPNGDGASFFPTGTSGQSPGAAVVITGHRAELEQLVQKVIQEGADAVCYKPFDVGRLLTTLDQLTHSVSHQSLVISH